MHDHESNTASAEDSTQRRRNNSSGYCGRSTMSAMPQSHQQSTWTASSQFYHQSTSVEESRTLWIGDLQKEVDESYLHSCFSDTEKVLSIKIFRYGFVEFVSHDAAERILQKYNGKQMPGTEQAYKLNWASLGIGERRIDAGPEHSIFVGDLALNVTDYMLQEAFRVQYPSVRSAKVVTDRNTGRSKGYGFVNFADETERNRAITEMNGVYCSTRPMRINTAKSKKTTGFQQQYPAATGTGWSKKGDSSTAESKGRMRPEADKEPDVEQVSISTAAARTAAQECEKWRLRGSQAYANGNSSIAEDYYSRGVNCISPNEKSGICLEALVLCYSERAATRMALGRMREALKDCKTAAAIDPNFLKVQVIAANCHLAMGEIEEAEKHFKICLQSGTDVCLDRKLVIEAFDGLQKAQQVAQHIHQSIELLRQRTQSDAEKVLQIVAKGLEISPYSEKLVEMKAEALFMLRKYGEVIQLCEQTLDSAERNSVTISSDCPLEKMDSSKGNKNCPERLWRVHLISKSYFYLGKLEKALSLLEKQEILKTTVEKDRSKTMESLMTLTATLRELLRHKAAGNEAFQSGSYSEAVKHYTAALSCNIESRPFAAVCICNRAAAYKGLGQITDAIADCSLAIALDGNYSKAIFRRATLHKMIRDYGQAIDDLKMYISLLERQSEDKTGATGESASTVNDLRNARLQLSSMVEEAKKRIPLNMYIILGVEPTDTASDIKKAYHKAALRHHPDKAGQFLARTDNGDDGLWKEIAAEVYKDADRLFKMIGEAYTVLSDPTKRSRHDLEEEIRNSSKKR